MPDLPAALPAVAAGAVPAPIDIPTQPGITVAAAVAQPPPGSIVIPPWLAKYGPLLAALLVGGGGTQGAAALLGVKGHQDEPAQVSDALSQEAFSSWAGAHSMEPHPGAATDDEVRALAEDVANVLWLVCELAARSEPPIRDRRCSTQ